MPTYVVEFLLGRYCASTDPAEIEEGLQFVEKLLQGRTVRAWLAIRDAQIDDELVIAQVRNGRPFR